MRRAGQILEKGAGRGTVNRTDGLELGEELLTFVFLALLAAAWIAVFASAAVRAKKTAPLTTAQRFQRGMKLIAPPEPAPRRHGPRRVRAARTPFARRQRRRRYLLAVLSFAVPVSAIAALVEGGALWEVQLVTDATLALYVAFLLEARRRRAERSAKVSSIARRRSRARPRTRRDRAVHFYEPVRAEGRR
jgi:hypothetical protein